MHNFIHFILSNPLLAGGAGLGIAGGIAGSLFGVLRPIPGTVMSFVKRRFITSINFISQDPAFDKLQEWINDQEFSRTARLLQVQTLYGQSSLAGNTGSSSYLGVVPAPGPHTFKYKGKRIWLKKDRHEQSSTSFQMTEEMTLSVIGGPDIMRGLLQDVEEHIKKKNSKFMKIFFKDLQDDNWTEFLRKIPRPLDSVLLDHQLKEGVINDLEVFLNSYHEYENLGIPYHRNYLFYGPPGNGKSSFIEALAGKFKMDLYILNLANKMNDEKLASMMMQVPNNGILLIEDIDAAFVQREAKEAEHITFSGLLNSLDGVSSRTGQVVMMSTNHIESLDEALLRPGRTDIKIPIENPKREQMEELFGRFFPNREVEVKLIDSLIKEKASMAAVQEKLKEMAA